MNILNAKEMNKLSVKSSKRINAKKVKAISFNIVCDVKEEALSGKYKYMHYLNESQEVINSVLEIFKDSGYRVGYNTSGYINISWE